MKATQHSMFVLLFLVLCFANTCDLHAEAQTMLSFQPGAEEKQFGVVSSPEGPTVGPMSLLVSGAGVVVLDAVNQRLVRLDGSGTFNGIIPLPDGQYRDITRSAQGSIWFIEAKKRAVMKVSGGGIRTVFELPRKEGFPRQIDHLLISRKYLVVMDYSENRLFFFSPEGKVEKSVEIPTALSFAVDSQNRICFLGMTPGNGDDAPDLYNRLIRINEDGVREEKVLLQGPLEGARLLGFTPTDKPIIFGVASQEPFKRELFLIDGEGKTETIDSFSQPLMFATRYGNISGSTLWLNVSPLTGGKIIFQRYELK